MQKTSCENKKIQYKASCGYLRDKKSTDKDLAFTNLVFRLVLIFKASWQEDSMRKYNRTLNN